jgi:hypothetical protein
MQINSPATELTTAATDALLALVCVCLIAGISTFRAQHRWKTRLWSWVLGLLALASFLGAIAHGFDLSPGLRNLLWQPLYLALGIDVVLFVLGGVYDWLGEGVARRMFPGVVLIGGLFYCVTLMMSGAFVVLVAYEGAAMAAAMAIYMMLAARIRLPGAVTIAVAIVLNILAAALQASAVRITVVWPFDHNGVFHLVQMAALLVLGHGLRASMSCQKQISRSGKSAAET